MILHGLGTIAARAYRFEEFSILCRSANGKRLPENKLSQRLQRDAFIPATRHNMAISSLPLDQAGALKANSNAGGVFAEMAADCETLREIVAGLEQLEQTWGDARKWIAARARGYFTPDEDDHVRQMLLSYRNYRIVLYHIIDRCRNYAEIPDQREQIARFMLGFAAGLTLYSKSLTLIQSYERQPLVRKKLNEPEANFELEPDFFEEVLGAYSSLRNFWRLFQGSAFWARHARAAKRLGLLDSSDGRWLAQLIHTQRKVVRN